MVMLLVIVADVIIRYTSNNTIVWGFEFTEYAMVYLTFLGTAWVLKNNDHVSMEVLVVSLKPRPKAVLNFVASLLLVAACFMLLWYGASSTIGNIQNHILSVKYYSMPMYILIIVIPISSFLLLIQAIKNVPRTYRALKSQK